MATIAYLQSTGDGTNLTTYTFSSQNLGVADADRYIICTVSGRFAAAGSDPVVSSVTIGGVTATINVQTNYSGNGVAIATAAVPTGTTGDVVVTWDQAMGNCDIALYRATNINGTTAYDTGFASNTDPLSTTVDTINGGVGVGVSKNDNGTASTTWVGLTEAFDDTDSGGNDESGASEVFSSTASGVTVSCDWTTTTRQLFAVATFDVPASSTAGDWISNVIDASVEDEVIIRFTSTMTGSDFVKYDILESDNTSKLGSTISSNGVNTVDVSSSAAGSSFRVQFHLYSDVGSEVKVEDFGIIYPGAVLETTNLGSDLELSSTKFNRVYYKTTGSFTHLLSGSFSTDNGSNWTPTSQRREVTIPSAQTGSEILFRAVDLTGSVELSSITFSIKQDDF